jgi:hypothetical protein
MSNGGDEFERRARERVYFLWERAGRLVGRADEFWQQALDEDARVAEEEQRIDEEAQESFPASDPPSHTGITGEGRRDR